MGEPPGFGFTRIERPFDRFQRQRPDGHSHGKVAKIAIGIDGRGGLADNGAIIHVHPVGDHGRRRIGLGGGSG